MAVGTVRTVYYKSVQTHELFLKKRFVYSLSLTYIVSASAPLPQPRHGCLRDAVASSVLQDGQGGEDLYAASNALDGNLSTAFVSGGVREGQVKCEWRRACSATQMQDGDGTPMAKDGMGPGHTWAKGEGGGSLTSKKPPSTFLAQRNKISWFYYTFLFSFNLFHLFSGIHLRTYTQTRPLPTLSNALLDYKYNMRVSPVDLLPFP